MLKRLFDVITSLAALILLSPILLIAGLLVKLTDGGPVFYKQERVGYALKPITLLKFRSMTDVVRERHQQTFDSSPGVTKVGKILRRFKIDELPQLFNVLKGDLSIVGPRPCLSVTLDEFGAEASEKRHSLRPGLTGLAQVNGNTLIPWQQRLEYDLYYVDHQSFLLDLKILFKTVLIVFFGEAAGKPKE